MVKDLYQKSFSVLMKRPFRLWGLSLLAGVLLLAAQAGFIGVPAVAFCAALLLGALMATAFFGMDVLLAVSPFLLIPEAVSYTHLTLPTT